MEENKLRSKGKQMKQINKTIEKINKLKTWVWGFFLRYTKQTNIYLDSPSKREMTQINKIINE